MTRDDQRTETVQQRLLAWYDVEARDLPWRRTSDPYVILVSEVMLQQTRVETVLAYFERFLDRFPTIESLAEASIDDVLKIWEGLGYYRRAHNLHCAARFIAEYHGGSIPSSVADLRALPGIGPYTAGAIASIAFGLDEPVLDGNVIRVLARLFLVAGDTSKARARRDLLALAKDLVPAGQASVFNQALMDLGACICRPRSPSCVACPIASFCDAHHIGEETRFPEKPLRKEVPHRDIVAGIIWDAEPLSSGAGILIAKRHADDMLGGLWEFPGGHVEAGESFEGALQRELREELAIEIDRIEPFMDVDHAYTHFRMTLHCFHCRHTDGTPTAVDVADFAWVGVEELSAYAFPGADQRILEKLGAQDATSRQSMRSTSLAQTSHEEVGTIVLPSG